MGLPHVHMRRLMGRPWVRCVHRNRHLFSSCVGKKVRGEFGEQRSDDVLGLKRSEGVILLFPRCGMIRYARPCTRATLLTLPRRTSSVKI